MVPSGPFRTVGLARSELSAGPFRPAGTAGARRAPLAGARPARYRLGVETPRRAWLVWGVALAIYVVAVFHRTSLAVAGLAATERFDLSASQLGSFTVLQLLVYAGMQVPVGLLVDRFGPRTVLTAGVVMISVAQAGFALASSYPGGAGGAGASSAWATR